MYNEIIGAVIQSSLSYATPYTAIDKKSAPDNDGLAICMKDPELSLNESGIVIQTHMDKGSVNHMLLVLSGKNASQDTVISALSNIHSGLSQLMTYPSGANWGILSIDSHTAPYFIGLEEADPQQWYYGSILQVKFYVEGVS